MNITDSLTIRRSFRKLRELSQVLVIALMLAVPGSVLVTPVFLNNSHTAQAQVPSVSISNLNLDAQTISEGEDVSFSILLRNERSQEQTVEISVQISNISGNILDSIDVPYSIPARTESILRFAADSGPLGQNTVTVAVGGSSAVQTYAVVK